MAFVVKNPTANAGDMRDRAFDPLLGRSPGGGNGNPLQYSCLEKPMGKGALQGTVHRVAESDTTEHPSMSPYTGTRGALLSSYLLGR